MRLQPVELRIAWRIEKQGGRHHERGCKKGYGSTLALLSLGVLALYGGAAWLVVLIPAAVLVWFTGGMAPRRSRN